MSSTASWRIFVSALLSALLGGCVSPDPDALHFRDDFNDLGNWHIEAEEPGRIEARDGVLDIDVPAGATLWFKPRLSGSVRIEFEATAVAEGGPHDQVSDLNVFWMASNRDGSAPFPSQRSGAFAEYHDLLTYYVGLGGNRNTTTRFRRYIGDPQLRPLRPEHDLSAADVLLVPNQKQKIVLAADRNAIEYKRDDRTLFRFEDAAPYTSGWFALRTTQSHLRIRNLRIYARPPR
jgi:Domain of unknown function (DUF6250)